PAIILGFVVLFYLTDRPAMAHWLEPREREWLIAELAAERSAVEQVRVYTVLQSLLNLRVLALAVIYLGIGTASLGLVLFLPLMPDVDDQGAWLVDPDAWLRGRDSLRRRHHRHGHLRLHHRSNA